MADRHQYTTIRHPGDHDGSAGQHPDARLERAIGVEPPAPDVAPLLRDGQFYRADQATVHALEAVREVDPYVAATLFDYWREEGRVQLDHAANQRQAQSDPEYRLAAAEHLEDMFEVHQRDYAYETQPYTGPDSEPYSEAPAPRQGHRQ